MRSIRTATLSLICMLAMAAFALAQAPVLAPQQEGYEHGYRDGFHRGQEDHAAGAKAKHKTDDWEHADRGYAKYMGDKDIYKSGYRSGYQNGYDDGYSNRRANFGRVYVRPADPYYRPGIPPVETEGYYSTDPHENVYVQQGWAPLDVASELGYRDGVTWAQYDMSHNNAPDPTKTWVYKRADHGYRDQYGDKDIYKNAYRQAFMQGYQDTFGYRP